MNYASLKTAIQSYVENEFDLDEHVKWRLDLNKLYNENR